MASGSGSLEVVPRSQREDTQATPRDVIGVRPYVEELTEETPAEYCRSSSSRQPG